jgi:hypothetical protein
MKFGLFYELQLPKPYDKDTWNPDDEHRIVKEALEQVELADRLGFDYVFEVEHHHLEEYAHSTAPEVFLAAARQRTKNMRLGHGIVLTPPPTTTPAASPNGSLRSTSSPTVASSSARASPPPPTSSTPTTSPGTRRRRCGRRAPALPADR